MKILVRTLNNSIPEEFGEIGKETKFKDSLDQTLHVGDIVDIYRDGVFKSKTIVIQDQETIFLYGLVAWDELGYKIIKSIPFDKLEENSEVLKDMNFVIATKLTLKAADFPKDSSYVMSQETMKQRLKQILEATASCSVYGGNCEYCPYDKDKGLCDYIMNHEREFITGENESLEKMLDYILGKF